MTVIAKVFGGELRQDDTLAGAVSYDGAGRRFVFVPPARNTGFALDVELRSQPAPENLTEILGDNALEIWTEIEVVAKLYDTPAHIILSNFPTIAQKFPAELIRCDTASHFIAVGRKT